MTQIMKLIYTISVLSFFMTTLFGQEFSMNIISAAGDYHINEEGTSISWTMGQIFNQSILGDDHLTEGFQQGKLQDQTVQRNSSKETSSPNATLKPDGTNDPTISIVAYPNPTTDKLSLTFDNTDFSNFTIHIIDLSGKHWMQQEINNTARQLIDVMQLPSGNYILQIRVHQKVIGYKKITKI